MTDDDKLSQPWGHIHAGLEHLNKPAADIEKTEGLGWGYDAGQSKPQVNGQSKERLNLEELETLTFLSDGERETTSIEKVLATMSGDKVGLSYRADFMRTSVGVKGRGRESVHKILQGQAPKISIPTTLQKVRRIFVGKRGKMQEEGREVETETGYGEGD